MSTALKIAPPQRLFTWEQYEKAEQRSAARHEYVNGRVYAMAGGTKNHNRISGNVFGELRALLRGKKCEAFVADVKLRISLEREQFGYYPDVMVVCDPADGDQLHVKKPSVVFEVLSKSTERTDRHEKLLAYQAAESLQVCVLLEQTAPQATIYRRSGNWEPETISGPDAVINLPEIEVQLPLAALYERVDWNDQERDEGGAA